LYQDLLLSTRLSFMLDIRQGWLRSTSLLAVALFLSACAVGPDFERPEAPSVKNYAPGTPLKTTAGADGVGGAEQKLIEGKDIPGEWWELFHSEPLNKLVRQAFVANPDLQAAQATLNQAQDSFYAGLGSFLPSVNGTGSVTRQKTSGATTSTKTQGSIYNLYNASIGVSYTFDLFGGTRRTVEALGAEADYERFQFEAAYLTLTSNLVTQVLQEASLRAQIDATREIAIAQTKQLEMVLKQFDLGAVARTAVLTQQSSLAATEASLPGLEKQLAITRHGINILIGQFPSEEIEATFSLDALQLPSDLPLTVPSKLVEQRPDIRASEALLHKASAEVGVATANMLPQITLSADLGSAAQNMANLFKPGAGLWSLGSTVAQPIFEGGSLFFKREAAKDALEAASANYRSVVLSAFKDVADTLKALEMDSRSLKAQVASEKAAKAALDIATKQFQTGAISYLSLLTAQQNYQTAKIALVKAQATRFADTAALYQALGGGWWNRTDDPDTNGDAENKAVKPAAEKTTEAETKTEEPAKVEEPAKTNEPESDDKTSVPPSNVKQSNEDGAKI
jgi:NodT family efflux transporter outer membrane factor (OMF) lipoprotein